MKYNKNKFIVEIEYDYDYLGCEIVAEDIFQAISKEFSLKSLSVAKEV